MTAPGPALDLSTYLVTDTALCAPRSVPQVVAAAVRGGATCVQVREKSADGRAFLALVRAVVEAAGGVPVLVNDRLDVALAARQSGVDVAGVHLGQSDLPPRAARALLWAGAVIGVSVTNRSELDEVVAWPAGTVDHLGVGPVHQTDTKPGHAPVLGLDGAARLAAATHLPCVAIGGLHAGLAGTLRSAGIAGAAYVSAICASAEPERAARQIALAWSGPENSADRSTGLRPRKVRPRGNRPLVGRPIGIGPAEV